MAETYTRIARGGPLDGQPLESRFPAGVLLVDKARGLCWIYDATDDGAWTVRPSGQLQGERPWDRERSRTAADGIHYDVRALDVTE